MPSTKGLALRAVVALPVWAGAKAAAEPTRRERAATFMVDVVENSTRVS